MPPRRAASKPARQGRATVWRESISWFEDGERKRQVMVRNIASAAPIVGYVRLANGMVVKKSNLRPGHAKLVREWGA